jgi:hypothetical protein
MPASLSLVISHRSLVMGHWSSFLGPHSSVLIPFGGGGVAVVDARTATPPDRRRPRRGLAGCRQLDPSHPALVTCEDAKDESCLRRELRHGQRGAHIRTDSSARRRRTQTNSIDIKTPRLATCTRAMSAQTRARWHWLLSQECHSLFDVTLQDQSRTCWSGRVPLANCSPKYLGLRVGFANLIPWARPAAGRWTAIARSNSAAVPELSPRRSR